VQVKLQEQAAWAGFGARIEEGLMATRTSGRTSTTDAGARDSGRGGAQTDRPERSERRERNKPAPQRSNPLKSVQSLYRDTMTEIHKVAWPDQQTTRNLTLIVIGTAVVLGALLGGIDALFVRLWQWIP
jgi:preprotein translocase subunit SecE